MSNDQLYRFVKASERLPEKEKNVFINCNGCYHRCYYRDKWFIGGTNVVYAYEHQNPQIEWLELVPASPSLSDWFEFVIYLTGYKKEQVESQFKNWERNIKK